nr:15431_t:CDS:2 [Entrophospora candida]
MYNIDHYFDFDNNQSATKVDKKKQQQMILISILLIGLVYYFMIYLPEEEKKKSAGQQITSDKSPEELKEDKSSSLTSLYQKIAGLFNDGDKNPKFYFSRAAPYRIYFPPSLREYYEKVETIKNPTRGIKDKNSRGNNALFYGTEGTGKTATMKNICVRADKYPLVEIKGSNLTPTETDQSSEILPLQKFAYTIKTEEDEKDEDGNPTGNKLKIDIEIGEFLEFF